MDPFLPDTPEISVKAVSEFTPAALAKAEALRKALENPPSTILCTLEISQGNENEVFSLGSGTVCSGNNEHEYRVQNTKYRVVACCVFSVTRNDRQVNENAGTATGPMHEVYFWPPVVVAQTLSQLKAAHSRLVPRHGRLSVLLYLCTQPCTFCLSRLAMFSADKG